MRKTLFAAAAIVALSFSLSACTTSTDASSSPKPEVTRSQSTTVKVSGSFDGLNGKAVSGTVKVTGGEVVLSGFASDEGPDLHVYLANGTDEAAVSGGKELGAVVFDKASQTFKLNGVDASGFTNVIIHCDKAKAVFGAATLS